MSQDPPIQLFVKLQFADIYSAGVRATARAFRFLLMAGGIGAVLFVVVLFAAILRERPKSDWNQAMLQLKPFLWLVGALAFLLMVLPALNARKLSRDPNVKSGWRYYFSDSGMEVENSTTKSTVKWAAFTRATESASAFFLYTSKTTVHIHPKRDLAPDQHIAAMRELLRTHIANTKLRRD